VRYHSQLVNSFISLLDLPQSRFDVETVLSLLDIPAIQRRFGLDDEILPVIRAWLRDTQTCWGIDAQDKARFDLPATDANTWRAGLDRLLLAYALPQANQPGKLFDNRAAFDAISGERAANMAKLCRFIDVLDTARKKLSRTQSAQQWQQTFTELLDFFYDVYSPEDEQALTTIRQAIDKLVTATETAKFDEPIDLAIVKTWLDSQIDNDPYHSRFMGHGVTFCGMVPMRSIPFEVVCLIGMNDASYPRRQPKLGFDLLAKHFRVGDRSRRDDDRYLFLEAMLSARSTLYISYVGASIHDNANIPPSVLVSDLRDVLNLSYHCDGYEEVWTSLLTEHPLQAFSRRYFDGKAPALFSYQQTHCPPSTQHHSTGDFTEPLPEADVSWRQVSLSQLIQFFKHPARYLMTERLGVRLEIRDEQLAIREPFQLDGLQAWQLRQQILSAKLNDTTVGDVQDYFEATGVLPQGNIGEYVFEQQHSTVERFIEKLPALPESVEAQTIDLKLDKFHLTGVLHDLTGQGLFNFRMAKTKGHDLVSAWLQHLVLNMIKPEAIPRETTLITEDNEYVFLPVDEAENTLIELLNLYWQGLHVPLPFFNQTSYAFAKASLNEKSRAQPDNAIWNAWLGGQYQMGEGEDLYHQQVFADGLPVESLQQLAEQVYLPIQQHIKGHVL
jgi:exodeoxyribonuclease V gamma subunit